MKYLKRYEDLKDEEHKYKIDDYVLLDSSKIIVSADELENSFESAFGKNWKNRDIPAQIIDYLNDNYVMIILTTDRDVMIYEYEIKRKMTKEEVEFYKTANKFNV